MTLRPRHLRGLVAQTQRPQPSDLSNWQIASYVLVRRYPVLTMSGVQTMDPKLLNQHLETLRGETK